MGIKEKMLAGALTLNIIVANPLLETQHQKEEIQDQIEQIKYEQSINESQYPKIGKYVEVEEIPPSQAETLAKYSENLKELAENQSELKIEKEELLEQIKAGGTPPQEEVLKNIKKTQQEYIKTTKELNETKRKHHEEVLKPQNKAREMEDRLQEIEVKKAKIAESKESSQNLQTDRQKLENSYSKACEFFYSKYNIDPKVNHEQAQAKIDNLRKQAKAREIELKLKEKIEELTAKQKEIVKDHKEQIDYVKQRPDSKEIIDRLEQLHILEKTYSMSYDRF